VRKNLDYGTMGLEAAGGRPAPQGRGGQGTIALADALGLFARTGHWPGRAWAAHVRAAGTKGCGI
jgi:hypothetical protein